MNSIACTPTKNSETHIKAQEVQADVWEMGLRIKTKHKTFANVENHNTLKSVSSPLTYSKSRPARLER